MSGSPPAKGGRRDAWRAVLAAHEKAGSLAAVAAADEALAAFPDDPEFLAAKGRQLTLLRRFAEAEACLAHALQLAPEDTTVLLHLAQLYVTLGRYEEAGGLIETVLAVGPERAMVLVRAGRLLHAMGHHLEGAELMARDPSLSEQRRLALADLAADQQAGAAPVDKAPLRRATEQLRVGKPEIAERMFAELARLRPGCAPAWLGLRGALEAQGRAEELRAWTPALPAFVTRRKLGGRGLVFDPRDRVPIRTMAEALKRVEGGPELLAGDDAYLVIDPGGELVSKDPVVSLDGAGADQLTVSYRTAPKYLAALRSAALVGEGLVLTEAGEMIAETIPPTKASKYGGVRKAASMTFDPARFRDGMGAVRIVERPALLMCGATDRSFGDWIINFPPRLAFAEAAGLHDLAVVVRREPQAQALAILEALGVGPERIVFHDPEGVTLFSRLVAPSWPTPERLAPTAGVYDVYRRLAPKAPPTQRPLLYLTRRNVASRRMVNEAEVCALFERRGFQAVDPGSLSFAAVRALFANPACVAGPFGSAYHNLAFSAGKPVSLVLLPDNTRHHLAEVSQWHADLDLRFGYLWGQSLRDPGGGPVSRHDPWVAPLERLEPAIDAILTLASCGDI